MMAAAVRGVRGVCGTTCGAENRDGKGLCGVCGVRPNVGAYARSGTRFLSAQHVSHTYAPPHTTHTPHKAGGARISGVRGCVRGIAHPAQACSRAGATSFFTLSRKKEEEGGKHGWC